MSESTGQLTLTPAGCTAHVPVVPEACLFEMPGKAEVRAARPKTRVDLYMMKEWTGFKSQ